MISEELMKHIEECLEDGYVISVDNTKLLISTIQELQLKVVGLEGFKKGAEDITRNLQDRVDGLQVDVNDCEDIIRTQSKDYLELQAESEKLKEDNVVLRFIRANLEDADKPKRPFSHRVGDSNE